MTKNVTGIVTGSTQAVQAGEPGSHVHRPVGRARLPQRTIVSAAVAGSGCKMCTVHSEGQARRDH